MQKIRFFHLAAIISLLKANNCSDEFHIKLIKTRDRESIHKHAGKFFWQNIFETWGKGQNNLILNFLSATMIQQSISAYV